MGKVGAGETAGDIHEYTLSAMTGKSISQMLIPLYFAGARPIPFASIPIIRTLIRLLFGCRKANADFSLMFRYARQQGNGFVVVACFDGIGIEFAQLPNR